MATWLAETCRSSLYIYKQILIYLHTFIGTIIVYIKRKCLQYMGQSLALPESGNEFHTRLILHVYDRTQRKVNGKHHPNALLVSVDRGSVIKETEPPALP